MQGWENLITVIYLSMISKEIIFHFIISRLILLGPKIVKRFWLLYAILNLAFTPTHLALDFFPKLFSVN